ncbi:unnamed protein product [Staurois parvus]|uniref:Uncharacterized protein n=1 Tax=Staurois parvus TaxID=386267 RepID=A0ABN9DBQ5_9NEOB|nr:unnamed protein product [Staurois parvus]
MLSEDAEPLSSVWTVLIGPVLITCTLPRKKKKHKNSLAIHTKVSMCRMATAQSVLSGDKRGREVRIKWPFYTMRRINPLGSTVIIASMLYCIYRRILQLWV